MNPWIALGLVLAWIASLAGVGYWQNEAGHTTERVEWQSREIKALAASNQKIKETEDKYRAAEHDFAVNQAAISTYYQEQLKNANQKTADLIAAARAGTFRLRDPATIARPATGSGLPQTAARPGGCDTAGDGRLSANATEFLLALTGRCNTVRDKLAACQAVVTADRTSMSLKK